MTNTPFTPAGSVSLAVTQASARVALGLPTGTRQCRVSILPTDDPTYIKFGDSTVAAATTDMRIQPGESKIFTIGPATTHVAAICAATETATLNATNGHGD